MGLGRVAHVEQEVNGITVQRGGGVGKTLHLQCVGVIGFTEMTLFHAEKPVVVVVDQGRDGTEGVDHVVIAGIF